MTFSYWQVRVPSRVFLNRMEHQESVFRTITVKTHSMTLSNILPGGRAVTNVLHQTKFACHILDVSITNCLINTFLLLLYGQMGHLFFQKDNQMGLFPIGCCSMGNF